MSRKHACSGTSTPVPARRYTSGCASGSTLLWLARTMELGKAYDDETCSVALHPSGLYAMVGFADKLRLLAILPEDFK